SHRASARARELATLRASPDGRHRTAVHTTVTARGPYPAHAQWPRPDPDAGLADGRTPGTGPVGTPGPGMIRIDRIWLAVDPMDMRAGLDTTLARVVCVFGTAHPHHAYVFANRRATRIKVLMHDGIGVWLATRRLNQGRF